MGGTGEEELRTMVFVDKMVDPAELVLVNTVMLGGVGEGVTVEIIVDDKIVVEPNELVVGIIMTPVDVNGAEAPDVDDAIVEP